jgi:hypothetical protein
MTGANDFFTGDKLRHFLLELSDAEHRGVHGFQSSLGNIFISPRNNRQGLLVSQS